MVSFFKYSLVFGTTKLLFFGTTCFMEQLYCVSRVVFYIYFAILIFGPNWPFCKGYSPCLMAIFANFLKQSHFSNSSCFLKQFFMEQLYCSSRDVFIYIYIFFFCNFNFWPKLTILQKLCIVAIFANFQNGLTFPIVAVFWALSSDRPSLLYF